MAGCSGEDHDERWLVRGIRETYRELETAPADGGLEACVVGQVRLALLDLTAGTDQNSASYWESMDDYQRAFELVVARKTCEAP